MITKALHRWCRHLQRCAMCDGTLTEATNARGGYRAQLCVRGQELLTHYANMRKQKELERSINNAQWKERAYKETE